MADEKFSTDAKTTSKHFRRVSEANGVAPLKKITHLLNNPDPALCQFIGDGVFAVVQKKEDKKRDPSYTFTDARGSTWYPQILSSKWPKAAFGQNERLLGTCLFGATKCIVYYGMNDGTLYAGWLTSGNMDGIVSTELPIPSDELTAALVAAAPDRGGGRQWTSSRLFYLEGDDNATMLFVGVAYHRVVVFATLKFKDPAFEVVDWKILPDAGSDINAVVGRTASGVWLYTNGFLRCYRIEKGFPKGSSVTAVVPEGFPVDWNINAFILDNGMLVAVSFDRIVAMRFESESEAHEQYVFSTAGKTRHAFEVGENRVVVVRSEDGKPNYTREEFDIRK